MHFNCKKYKSNVASDEGTYNAYLIILTINHVTAPAFKIDLKMKIVSSLDSTFDILFEQGSHHILFFIQFSK